MTLFAWSRTLAHVAIGTSITAALIILPWNAPTATPTGAGALIVRGGTLVEANRREPFTTLVVRDGRLAGVTATAVTGLDLDAQVIDARGKWIVPGLIDMHVHYHPTWMDPLFFRHGVTTVRDVGSGLDHILQLREENRAQGIARARVFACGPLIDGQWPRHGTSISVTVQTAAEARAAARRLLDRGVD